MKRLAALLLLATTAALAHGDAEWIQNDSQYRRVDGVHCCSKDHCRQLAPDEVQSEGPGQWLFRATGQRFQQDEKAVYPAIRPGFWACEKEGRVVCFFFEGGAT